MAPIFLFTLVRVNLIPLLILLMKDFGKTDIPYRKSKRIKKPKQKLRKSMLRLKI